MLILISVLRKCRRASRRPIVRQKAPRAEDERSAVARFLNPDQPFGPPEADQLFGERFEAAAVLFDRSNRIYAQAASRDAAYIVGRKGAGKTAFLFGSSVDKPGAAFVALKTSSVYSSVLATIAMFERAHTPMFVDHVAELWHALFLNVIAIHLARASVDEIASAEIGTLREYLPDHVLNDSDATAAVEWFLGELRSGLTTGVVHSLKELASAVGERATFEDAREALATLSRSQPQPVTIVMDNLEDLHVRLDDLKPVLQGLFRCVGGARTAQADRGYVVRVCLPSEPYDKIHILSSNPSKDFHARDTVPIYWSAKELLRLAGAHYALYLKTNQPDEYRRLEYKVRADPDEDRGLVLLRAALPRVITNGLGIPEDPVAYILRHTQLVPRHLIEILNAVFSSTASGSNPWEVTSEAVIKGVQVAERLIVASILGAYSGTYPDPQSLVRSLSNRIGIRLGMNELHQVFNHAGVRKSTGLVFAEYVEALVNMGVLGVFDTETERYYKAMFQYTFSAPLSATEGQDDLCLHPLFTRYLHVQSLGRLHNRSKVTYPYGSDPAEDYREAIGYE